MMNFANKTFIITGASAGIGKALALKLAQQGTKLVLAARNRDALEMTAEACIQSGTQALSVPTDVTNPTHCSNLIEQSINFFGAIDGLVNNAGISMSVQFEEVQDLTLFERIMQVNYLGAVYCTHYALPYLKASQGLLVAISSLSGKTGVPTRSGYVASKHAMQGFFDSLRIELRGTGVDVLVVSPGFVATDIRDRILGGDGKPIVAGLPKGEKNMMSVEECVNQIVRAMQGRKRELVMTNQGRFGRWIKLIAPDLLDKIVYEKFFPQ